MNKAWLKAARTLYLAIHSNFTDGAAFGSKLVHREAFHVMQSFTDRLKS